MILFWGLYMGYNIALFYIAPLFGIHQSSGDYLILTIAGIAIFMGPASFYMGKFIYPNKWPNNHISNTLKKNNRQKNLSLMALFWFLYAIYNVALSYIYLLFGIHQSGVDYFILTIAGFIIFIPPAIFYTGKFIYPNKWTDQHRS